MFKRVERLLKESDAVHNVKTDMETPTEGVIYFTLATDDSFEEQLKYFQPENSAVVVESGDIVEFDVRIGQWSEENQDKMMEEIKEAVQHSRRNHYIPPTTVHRGGSAKFVPHVTTYNGRVAEEPFIGFLEALAEEVKLIEKFNT